MRTIRRAETPEDIDAVRALMGDYMAWAMSLDPEATAAAPTFDGVEAELAGLPGAFGPPDGCLLIARDGDDPVGCGGWRALGGGTVELKRMYVRPDQRGKGLGRAMLDALLAEARAAGLTRVVLDSLTAMTGSHRIYRAAGFRDAPPSPDFPPSLVAHFVFMELTLA